MKRSEFVVIAAVLSVLVCLPVSAAGAYEEAAVSDGGSIKGTVVYNSAVPMRKIIPTKDQEVCGGVRDEPQVFVGPGNKVMDAIAYLKGVPKGKKWERPKKPPRLVNKNCTFVPRVQVIPAGMNVAIVNSDPVLHNTHGFLIKRTVFNVAMPKTGMRVERSLQRPGVVRVECDSHGWMLAWIYVADNPYYMMTGKDGTFTIGDVPPGNHTLVVWQEHAGTKEIPVTVKPRETVTVPTIELK
ncbi:MAG: hypothetical protein A2V87_04815 [Deltaproteobacteria bacterium RBG_16_58_17]|nr:MAG: hypothetical protein A2V87_04815 [Deltaproteobacteria bacterium RBG_16_58_17]OHE21671.1 MAG: hypothetical protein A2X95_08255 [Syntrophobacterales bacterium GWF2_56_9]